MKGGHIISEAYPFRQLKGDIMNLFRIYFRRNAAVCCILILLLTLAVSFCSLGVTSLVSTEQQLRSVSSQYTTIAVPSNALSWINFLSSDANETDSEDRDETAQPERVDDENSESSQQESENVESNSSSQQETENSGDVNAEQQENENNVIIQP